MAVRAVARVRTTHDVSLDMVSDVPDLWREEVGRSPGVTLPVACKRGCGEGPVRAIDVLLFPSHMDTLGFVMSEAMAHGMPGARGAALRHP